MNMYGKNFHFDFGTWMECISIWIKEERTLPGKSVTFKYRWLLKMREKVTLRIQTAMYMY